MSESEMLEKIKKLEEENKLLRGAIERKTTRASTVYENLRQIIRERIDNEIHETRNDFERKSLVREIADDMKWDLRRRKGTDFTKEDIPQAIEYIKNYKIDEHYYRRIGE